MSNKKKRKPGPSKRRSKSSSNSGIPFERAVAALQSLMDPTANVTHNEIIVDRLGHKRQFDVVIRSSVGGHDILGVVECKDLNRKVGTPEINAFADKARNARANLTLFVSRKGFTKQALELARDAGIGTFSLLREDHGQSGFTIGADTYISLRWWELPASLTINYAPANPGLAFGVNDVVWEDQPVAEWVVNELSTRYSEQRGPATCVFRLNFRRPTPIRIGAGDYLVNWIEVPAVRRLVRRRGALQFAGRALVDWQKGGIKVPSNSQLTSAAFNPIEVMQRAEWEIFPDDVPLVTGWLQFHFDISASYTPNRGITGDLRSVADVQLICVP